jgi:hypothetical protein
MGLKKKGAAMEHPKFDQRVWDTVVPIYTVAPKHEWKEIIQIQEKKKIRTFIIESVESMIQKKMLYHN